MKTAFVTAFVALCGAGCVSRPDPASGLGWDDVPRDYSRPASAAAPVKEGRFPVDLPTVLRLAGANNLEIALVREKLHEGYARARMADERFWPNVYPMYSFRRHEGLTQATDGTFVDVDKQQTFVGAGASLRWELGEAIYSSLSASQRYEGRKSLLEATEQGVLLEAASAYYDLVREHLRARVAEESAAVSEKLASQLDVSVQAGRGFKGDVLRARVQSGASRLALLRAKEGIGLASIRLGTILRLAPGVELYPVDDLPPPLELIPSASKDDILLAEAYERRPEIREARFEATAAGLDRSGSVWGPLIPGLQVDALLGGLEAVPSDLESTRDYAVTLGWKIGPGGLFDPGRRDLSDAQARQAEIQVERVRQKVAEQVLSSLTQLRSAEEQRKLAEQAVRDAEEALRLNQQRQVQNIGIPLEVLQAEEALTRARLDHFTTIIAFNQAQLRLFWALGRRHAPSR